MATSFAFFSPLTRAWEFLTGVLIVLLPLRRLPGRRTAEIVGWSGLAVIALGYLLLTENEAFPGWQALIPVMGTAAVLIAGGCERRPTVARAVSTRPLVRIGDLSYSWYLWHWPMIVFALVWFDSPVASIVAAAISLLPAALSYRYFERPIHLRVWLPSNSAMVWAALALVAVPFLSGLMLVKAWSNGWWRPEVAQLQQATSILHLDATKGCADVSGIGPGSGSCVFNAPGATGTVLLVGDSNAGMYVEPMITATRSMGLNLEVATRNGCPFQAGVDYGSVACRSFVSNVINSVSTADPPYAVVVIVNSGKYATSVEGAFKSAADLLPPARSRNSVGFALAVRKAVEAITQVSPVVVIEPIPQASGGLFPRCVLPSSLFSIDQTCATFSAEYVTATRTEPVTDLREVMDDVATLYDPSSHLCNPDGTCSMFRGERLVYRDDSHLSVAGSQPYADDLRATLDRAMASH